jgi:hypothetical protein
MNTTPENNKPGLEPRQDGEISATDQPDPAQADAQRAERARQALRIMVDRYANVPPWEVEGMAGAADLAEAIASFLHLAEAIGLELQGVVTAAIRAHAHQRAAEIEFIENVGVRLNVCRYCGEGVDEVLRWFEPCARCRYSEGIYPKNDGMPDDPTEQNETRADWAEAAAQTFASLTRWGWDFITSDTEGQDEILGDLFGDLRHLAKRLGLDPEELAERGKGSFEEECAEAEATSEDD